MSIAGLFLAPPRSQSRIVWRGSHQSGASRIAAVVVFLAGAGAAGCASSSPFNPAGLDESHLGQVDNICQSQLGLSPDEQAIYGPGTPGLDTDTENHYQGCIASLSRTLQGSNDASASVRANQDCEARGLPSGSPALAQCVLASERAGAPPMADHPAEFVTLARTARPGSYYSATPRHQRLMEENACATLGMNPVGEAFDACVKSLQDTFYSIDNPIN